MVINCVIIGVMKPVTRRAQYLLDASMELTLRPQKGDRQRLIAFILREVADRFCTDWGELEHPYDVLNNIANEVESL
jgi:hypothetical protein